MSSISLSASLLMSLAMGGTSSTLPWMPLLSESLVKSFAFFSTEVSSVALAELYGGEYDESDSASDSTDNLLRFAA